MVTGPYPIPGATMPTWLVRFDKSGVCTSPATQDALLQSLRGFPHTDILFYSHGWNTDFNAAVDQYSRFLTAFQAVAAAHPPKPGFQPIFVGVTWPSVWMPGSKGPDLAMTDAENGGEAAQLAQMRQELAESLPEAKRARFYELTDVPSLTPGETRELADLSAALISPALEDVDPEAPALDGEQVIALANLLAYGEGAATPQDLDQIGTAGGGVTDLSSAGDFNPLRIIKLASVYQMKDRAGYVGSRGVATLLRGLLSNSQAPVHVFGHSFGAKVMLAAISFAELPRPVRSLLLLQPALSHLAFAPDGEIEGRTGPGGYRAALGRVDQPILTTYSRKDDPLHKIFHHALRRASDLGELQAALTMATAAGEPPNKYAALGGYGPRKSSEQLIHPMPSPGQAWPPLTAELVGLDGSDDQINSHGDVANPFTAWALRRLIVGS